MVACCGACGCAASCAGCAAASSAACCCAAAGASAAIMASHGGLSYSSYDSLSPHEKIEVKEKEKTLNDEVDKFNAKKMEYKGWTVQLENDNDRLVYTAKHTHTSLAGSLIYAHNTSLKGLEALLDKYESENTMQKVEEVLKGVL